MLVWHWATTNQPTKAPAPQSECSMPCAGDSSQKCGGSWKMNIYQKAPGSQPNPNPNPIPNSIPGLDPEMEAFLAEIYLDDTDIKEKFAKEHVTLDLLKTMDLGHLKKIGITSYGIRHKLFKEVKNLDQGQPLNIDTIILY